MVRLSDRQIANDCDADEGKRNYRRLENYEPSFLSGHSHLLKIAEECLSRCQAWRHRFGDVTANTKSVIVRKFLPKRERARRPWRVARYRVFFSVAHTTEFVTTCSISRTSTFFAVAAVTSG
jgi:hypothetical protein